MKFFFPDSQDHVDPSFNFETEGRSVTRVRQRDDLYAHEIFSPPPFDGILVSKAIVDGKGHARYTMAQRRRLFFEGVQKFFRLEGMELETIGDCGAFSYRDEEYPPYTPNEVLDFYESCGFDYGFSVDHMIGAYKSEKNLSLPGFDVPEDWKRRQEITLTLATEYLQICKKSRVKVFPIGVAQGWSPGSYAYSVEQLQKMGYDYIALGGIVPLKTPELMDVLSAVDVIRNKKTRLHLLGVTRLEKVLEFGEHGVYSFDSTSPLMKGLKDQKNNYYTLAGPTYSSLAVPQVDGNTELGKLIKSGVLDQQKAVRLERQTLKLLKDYDSGRCGVEHVLSAVNEYGKYCGLADRERDNRRTLESKIWKDCECPLCKCLGIHIMLKRGAERNRRRGLHNVYIVHEQLRGTISKDGVANAGKYLAKMR